MALARCRRTARTLSSDRRTRLHERENSAASSAEHGLLSWEGMTPGIPFLVAPPRAALPRALVLLMLLLVLLLGCLPERASPRESSAGSSGDDAPSGVDFSKIDSSID